MVKNTTGGTGTKGLARKLQSRGDSRLQLSQNEFEQYAIVTKLLGNGMCEIYLNNNTRLIGHIRNKFRGRNKRHNLVSVLAIVLVGLRDYEKPAKNCDILTIYDDIQIDQLKQMPSIRVEHLMNLRLENIHTSAKDCNVDFTIEEDDQTISNILTGKAIEEFDMKPMPDIDIDDI